MKSFAQFITLEGIDGAGKTTHLNWMAAYLKQRGIDFILTREPGGTALGEQLREILLHQPMCLETEALLMFAARSEHLHQVILPALARGQWVISDRFTDASFAYQGGGRGLAHSKLEQLEQWVQASLQPQLTFLFDVPLEVSRERLQHQKNLDRFEQEQADFFGRVRHAYLERAKQHPHRIHVLDSSRSIAEIQRELEAKLAALCP